MEALSKFCIECNKTIKGRIDKKFCDDFCRNVYNNKLNSHSNAYVRNITNILRRNRRVLEETISPTEDMAKTTRTRLLAKGFNFKYLTHSYTNKKGNVYFFCFEFGYLPLEADWILVVKRKEEAVV